MAKIRLIIVADDWKKEDSIFTEEFYTDANEWCDVGQFVQFDDIIEAELPSCFPLEFALRKTL